MASYNLIEQHVIGCNDPRYAVMILPLAPAKNNQEKNVRWAKYYEL